MMERYKEVVNIATVKSTSSKKRKYPSYEEEKAGKLLQHKHCNVCGKAVPVSKDLCSEECEKQWEELVRKRKMMQYLFYGASIFLIMMILLSGLFQ